MKILLSAGVLSLSLLAGPAYAIITAGALDNPFYQASSYGNTYSGVGVVSTGCSGALFGSARVYVLTAAHCVANQSTGLPDSPNGISVMFPGQTVGQSALAIFVNPNFTGIDGADANDIAVIQLVGPEPSDINSYALYQGSDAVGKDFALAGWGRGGTGAGGPAGSGFGTNLRVAYNTYNFYAYRDPTHLDYTFESGDPRNNAACYATGYYTPANNPYNYNSVDPNATLPPCPYSLGRGNAPDGTPLEGVPYLGDSGGPSFYNGQIIGIHSYLTCISYDQHQCASATTTPQGPDYSTPPPDTLAFDFGEIAADTNVAYFTGPNGFLTQFEGTSIPEPGTWGLILSGTAFVAFMRRRKA